MNRSSDIMINVDPVWLYEPTDLSICKACGEKIYSRMVRLWIMSDYNNIRLPADDTGVVLCESCFEILKDRNEKA